MTTSPRRVWWAFSPTSVRLILGFLAPIAVFAMASILSMRNMERLVAATDTIHDLQRAFEAALHMQNLARQQDSAQADLSLGEDLSTIERFDRAQSRMRRLRLELADALEKDLDRQLLWQSRRLEQKVHSIFHTRFVPAVMDEDAQRIRQLRVESSALLGEVVTISERLARSIQARIDEAAVHAGQVRRQAVRNTGLLLGAAVIVAVGVALLTSRSVVGPIQRLIAGTEALARGRLDHTIHMDRRDEFGRLAESFNRMTADLVEHQHRLLQAQKMASLGQLAAGVAHEINNPIGVILGYADVLANDPNLDPSVREDVATIEEEARQCKRIVEDLLNLSRPMTTAEDLLDVADSLRQAAARVSNLEGGARIQVQCDVGDRPIHVRGDADKLRQVLDNLVRNAVDAMPECGTLRIRGQVRPEASPDEADQVVVEVRDSGPGMTEEQCQRAFDPFFSTKSSGTGLGLSIVYSIVQAHRGHISLRSAEGQGATFTIVLPRAADAEA